MKYTTVYFFFHLLKALVAVNQASINQTFDFYLSNCTNNYCREPQDPVVHRPQ